MRFHADGPSIPSELLDARDRGNVVFFCGAGVSRPAGLPSFPELARRVMKALGTDANARSRTLLEQSDGDQNLDRVFNLLQQEYRRDEVEAAVNRILKTPPQVSTTAHATILRLSCSTAGRPRVVTTNFDHLFERVAKSVPVHVAPALPDIRSVGSFDGLVYLHGRRGGRGPSAGSSGKGLILSSSDFGRAYLADGWATRFVRDLLQNYFIVLVGYSASDPPVRYLLEGLQSRRANESSTIYAFDHGAVDGVLDRWRSLGVHALPYPTPPDRHHTVLWNTLSAWRFGLMIRTSGVDRSGRLPRAARFSLSPLSAAKWRRWFETRKARPSLPPRPRHHRPNGCASSIDLFATPSLSVGSGKTILTRFRYLGWTMILHAQKERQTRQLANRLASTFSLSWGRTSARTAIRGSLESRGANPIRCRIG